MISKEYHKQQPVQLEYNQIYWIKQMNENFNYLNFILIRLKNSTYQQKVEKQNEKQGNKNISLFQVFPLKSKVFLINCQG
ncbi:unnamed protein product [Paramecium octaurelia]|uniref:Uncharacterized protein n=1 Tax=Paramecium octaurelia TaxID=43137 RepID=A0A8S1XB88_PAROT|nr:unnamed protein product [Paramecium octaurelia]